VSGSSIEDRNSLVMKRETIAITIIRKRSSTTLPAQNRTVIIVNPNSCSGLTGKNWDSLYSSIKQVLGENLKVVISKRPGDGTSIARNCIKRGFNRVVAIGGDGTLNEVANGFFEEPAGIFSHAPKTDPLKAGKQTQRFVYRQGNSFGHISSPFSNTSPLKPINPEALFAIVPSGTRNVLARSLGLPEGIVECCKTFSAGTPKKIDVIVATVTDPKDGSVCPKRVVLNAAEIGLGAEIIDRSKKVRRTINSRLLSTAAGIISTLPTYQSNKCEILLSDNKANAVKLSGKSGEAALADERIRRSRKIITNMTMGVISNGRFLGGGFLAAPKADMSDGLLDVVILKDSGSFKVVDDLVNVKDGDYKNDDKILYTQATKVLIKSKERDVTVTVDGEPIGILPAAFEIFPNALTLKM
jgi:diacylglycerol kinase family enzyme